MSTALANRVGREIWGYNKFVAAIDFKYELHKFWTSLRDPENAIIGTLEGRWRVVVDIGFKRRQLTCLRSHD